MDGEDTKNVPDDEAEGSSSGASSTSSSMSESESDGQSYCRGSVTRITVVDKYERSKTYRVHQRLLASKSPYFAALPNFQEGEENHVTLCDIDHRAFKELLNWLYEGRFGSGPRFDRVTVDIFIDVWAAADRLLMSKCKNMAVDLMRKMLRQAQVDELHLETVKDLGYLDSTLARMLMDQIARDCTTDRNSKDDSVKYEVKLTDPEMAMALTKRIIIMARAWSTSKLKGGQGPKDPSKLVGCHYHEHVEEEKCYLTEAA